MSSGTWDADKPAVGAYIRQQRELARLSLRELSRMSQVSNAYLSQIERGLHEPSLRVMRAVADALAVPLADLLARTAGSEQSADDPEHDAATPRDRQRSPGVEEAIRAEARLSPAQQEALIAVYRSYLAMSVAMTPGLGRRER